MTEPTNAPAPAPENNAPPAPAPAPAAPAPAPAAPTPLPAEGDEGAGGKFAYNETGDAGLDMALSFIGDNGFGPDHPAMQAAINGNFDLLEAELAKKDVKGYAAYIKLAQKAYAEISEKTKAKRAADAEAVAKAVGGEERWTAVQAWAAENADEAEKPSINAMLSKGGLEAQMAATWLSVNYDRANGAGDTEGSGPPVAETRGAPSAGNDALNPQDYGRAVAKARSEHKGREPFENSKAYADLRTRRERFKG